VPKIRQARAKVCGCHFDEGVIRRIVRSHINEIRHCYNEALVRDPNRAGRVELTFYVGPTGKVAISDVSESTLGDPIAERCMAKAVKRWKFPRPRGTGSAKVVYPFVLSPG
jgi:TonB family protein